MAAVLGVKLERKRPFVVNELGDATICKTQYKGGFSGSCKVQLFGSAFLSRMNGGFGCKSAGDRPHELEEGGRHAFLVPMSFRDTQTRFAAVHRLVKIILSLFVTMLLLLLLPTKPVTRISVSFVLLLLGKNQEVEWSKSLPGGMSAIISGLTNGVLADETIVELKVARLLLNLSKSSEVVEACLPSPFAVGWPKGWGIRGKVAQES